MTFVLPITLLLYLVSAAVIWRSLSQQTTASRWILLLPVIAVLGHGALQWYHLQQDQFDNINIASSLSAVALFLVVLSLIRGTSKSGLLLRPVIFIFAAVSCALMVFSPTNWGAQIDSSTTLMLHIVLSLLAYAVLMLATLYAVQLLYLTYLLKHHKAHATAKYLPPLMSVERYFFRLLSTGTLLLLLALASGLLFLDDMFAQGQAHKTILSSAAALIYLVVCYYHGLKRARGRALVISSVGASIILTLAYFGSRFVKDILLST